MRLSIRVKQIVGVTAIVGLAVVALSALYTNRLANVVLRESLSRGKMLANTILHRAGGIVTGDVDPYLALREDGGLRSILESSIYGDNISFAAIVDTSGTVIVHNNRAQVGRTLAERADLEAVIDDTPLNKLRVIFAGDGQTLEVRETLKRGSEDFGSIRIGVSTLLIRQDLDLSLRPAIATAFAALAIAVMVAMLLAQLLLRPIHVIRSGLTRLGRGELDVRLDLDQSDEFGELGTFFNAVTAQLSADRSQMAGQVANLESAVEHLEDALAIVSPRGELLFANPSMRTLLPKAAPGIELSELVPADHPVVRLSEQTLMTCQSRGPLSATFPDARAGAESGERLVMTHAVNDAKGQLVAVMIIARNLEYLSQVQSTIRYSRKLAALGRLSAGVAHEVKNPLNAMMIHLELLRQQFAPSPGRGGIGRGASARTAAASAGAIAAPPVDTAEAIQHVDVIAGEIRRLDEVVQGFLRFSRPEDLRLQPVRLESLLDEIVPIVRPEAERLGVEMRVEGDAPDVNADPAMLRQAFLNLALNACQAMPNGGTLRVRCEAASEHRVSVSFIDTGVGIKPEHLQRIFDLYFTTKDQGSGIGLSMVYRTVQMHDGEIEVQSTPGAGTTFRVLLPRA